MAPRALLLLLFAAALAAQEPEPAPGPTEPGTPEYEIERLKGRALHLQQRITLLESRVRELEQALRDARERAEKPEAAEEATAELERRLARLEKAFLDQGLPRPDAAAPSGPRAAPPTARHEDGTTPWPDMPYGASLEFVVRRVRRLPQELPQGGRFYRLDVELHRLDDALRAASEQVAVGDSRYVTFPEGLPSRTPTYRLSIEQLGLTASGWWLNELAPRDEDEERHRCLKFIRVPKLQSHRDGYDGRSGTVRAWRGDLYWHENDVFFREDGDLHLLGEGAARHHIRFLRPLPAPREDDPR